MSVRPSWSAFERQLPRCHEWVSFGAAPATFGAEASLPGAVTLCAGGPGSALHWAPHRWLLLGLGSDSLAELAQLENSDAGVLVDVTGTWRHWRLRCTSAGTPADHPLAAAGPLDGLCADRGCAAAWFFDCPVLLLRDLHDYDVLVASSYVPSFLEVLGTLGVQTGRAS